MQQKIAVGVGYNFALVDSEKAAHIDLTKTGVYVKVDGVDYPLYKATTYEGSRKADDLLDRYGEYSINDYMIKSKLQEGKSR
ncbi:MAG: hypothetical protein PHI41_08555 [Erysipelotrichaceae bacterium]|nr:hypothetical protein [Erysipelotrichaceae bacterium]